MSLWREINKIKSSPKELREFGTTMGIFSGLLYCFLWWKKSGASVYLLEISGFFLIFAFVLPAALKPLQKIWMSLALAIGAGMSRVILVALFYLVFTPIGFFLRITGKDLLRLKASPNENSYWKDHTKRSKTDYEKQF